MVLAILLLILAAFAVLGTLLFVKSAAHNEYKVSVVVYNAFLVVVMVLSAIALM